MVGAMRGYKVVVVTGSKCPPEDQEAIRVYGATLVVAPPGQCHWALGSKLAAENPSWYSLNQYDNLDNPMAHLVSTGPEIRKQTSNAITHFVMGAMGSTTYSILSGVGSYLKAHDPATKVIHVVSDAEDLAKPQFSQLVDQKVTCSKSEALGMCQRLSKEKGLQVGGCAGLNVFSALRLATQAKEPAIIVTLLYQKGVKLMGHMYNKQWL